MTVPGSSVDTSAGRGASLISRANASAKAGAACPGAAADRRIGCGWRWRPTGPLVGAGSCPPSTCRGAGGHTVMTGRSGGDDVPPNGAFLRHAATLTCAADGGLAAGLRG
jgi:hypothetical protein